MKAVPPTSADWERVAMLPIAGDFAYILLRIPRNICLFRACYGMCCLCNMKCSALLVNDTGDGINCHNIRFPQPSALPRTTSLRQLLSAVSLDYSDTIKYSVVLTWYSDSAC
jgi:hypothetical protein